jgi:hypothetical protein
MIRLELLLGFATLCLFVFCLVNVIQTPESAVRNLPKTVWLLLVLFFPFVGSVAWLVAGRPDAPRPGTYERGAPEFPEYDRPGRAAASDPVGDEEFLRQVRARAEDQRRRQQRREERDEQRGPTPEPPADEA